MPRGLSTDRDKAIHEAAENEKLKKKRSSAPEDAVGERYVTGLENYRGAGKGDKYRNIPGWFSEETTEQLRRIFSNDKKKK